MMNRWFRACGLRRKRMSVVSKLMSNKVLGILAVALAVAMVQGGCTDRKAGERKNRTKEGVADKIDLANNSVSMKVSDGKGGEVTLEGQVREDTIVRINGREEKLEHVRPGDKVRVSGYREGEGSDAKLIATMVEVFRPEGSDWKSTGKAQEKPAESKQAPTPGGPATPATAPAAGTSETRKPG
ncbi:MAG TPA: hypothetical protein VMV94_13305 [Phycisphaerae bacterium]|nr:hypothetical protein [Phycisphaerae bacterium]